MKLKILVAAGIMVSVLAIVAARNFIHARHASAGNSLINNLRQTNASN
jgi:hypothetical protein